jgi:hypothetical protein
MIASSPPPSPKAERSIQIANLPIRWGLHQEVWQQLVFPSILKELRQSYPSQQGVMTGGLQGGEKH